VARPDRHALTLACLAACAAACAVACARDPERVAWDDAFQRAAQEGDVDLMRALAGRAIDAEDRGAALLETARAERRAGNPHAAALIYVDMARNAPRQDDRARAHYELARLAEERGNIDSAKEIYRALVRTYPDLMPGERALAHLLRIARSEGPPAVDAYFAWTASLYPELAKTSLGDNLLYDAAYEAEQRWRATNAPAWATRAEALYARVHSEQLERPLWNDAWWQRSLMAHALGRFDDEIDAIRRIQRTRANISLFGQNEHAYFWKGQLRIARTYLLDRHDPLAAARAYEEYASTWPSSLNVDDVLFFAGCAYFQAGDGAAAERAFARLATRYPDSKYVRRFADAARDPSGPRCTPPEVEP
jgi:tetratricopeptide (TPR) repeat protein